MEGSDFGGFATKANIQCSDGRTILPDAFKHQDGQKVPIVYQHGHSDIKNVLGYGILEARHGDMYVHGFFNETESGAQAKLILQHGDIESLSIYANRLKEKAKNVAHGIIREVSIVLSGANPGALIDNVRLAHGDSGEDFIDEERAIIYSGLEIETGSETEVVEHNEQVEEVETEQVDTESPEYIQEVLEGLDEEQSTVVHSLLKDALEKASGEAEELVHADETYADIIASMSQKQQDVMYHLISEALAHANTAEHSALVSQEGTEMPVNNIFEKNAAGGAAKKGVLAHSDGTELSHAEVSEKIFAEALSRGSLKEAVKDYALKHGIEEIETLFPDAKNVGTTPEWEKRRTEWVATVMNGVRNTPFSRIKSMSANITLDEARAKGYIKGTLKKEEFFKVSKRITTPQTVYKKQKLDRDDILDITDFDVVAWLKGEMRIMLEEEIARAILLGDGRSAGDEDKIREEHIRPIATDDDFYVTYLYVNLDNPNSTAEEIIDTLTLQRRHYRGSGNPTFFTSETVLARLLLIKDTLGRRIYPTVNDLTAALRVSSIVTVEVMDEPAVDVIGIMVNLQDYVVGADRGGNITLFDDFDIDYNQFKYLIETRISGALVKPKAAIVVKRVAGSAVLVAPVAPTWDDEDKTVTVATTANITYRNKFTNAVLTTASPVTLGPDDELTVIAVPNNGYHLDSSANDEFLYTYEGPAGSPF